MLRQIKLENFRKHESRIVTFEPGLNVMRAPNEGGKSTLIEAALYALFGATALRDSLADCVTWGRKESELKVSLTIEVGGQLYNFNRSKAGAECEHAGGLVTGQKEVSSFAAEILGADAQAANRLMLANQNNLRGALEEGPKAIAQQIETLADFDLFDRILEAANTRLLTGSPSIMEAKVSEAEDTLNSIMVTKPDLAAFDTQIAERIVAITASQAYVAGLEPQLREAESAFQGAENQQRMHNTLAGNLTKATDQHALHVQQKKDADAKAAVKVDVAGLVTLRASLADTEAAAKRVDVHATCELLRSAYPDVFWEGDKRSFNTEIDRLSLAIRENEAEGARVRGGIIAMQNEVKLLRAKIITSTACPTCGQEVKDHEHIAEGNAALQQEIASLNAIIEINDSKHHTVGSDLVTLVADWKDLQPIIDTAVPFENFVTRHGDDLNVDLNFYPPKFTWAGEVPRGVENIEDIKQRIQEIEGQKDAVERAAARSEALAQVLIEDTEYIGRVKQQLAECPAPGDTNALKDLVREIGNRLVILRDDVARYNRQVSEVEQAKNLAKQEYDSIIARKADAEKRLADARADLSKLVFNNALLKKIRAARPLIADKLWSTVLSAVSAMFSQMRGEASVVVKDKDGFSVNGAPVTSLSGSTLDLLGLAIRVALVRTFLPHTSFLVLDEPGAAMDVDRITQMLGFVAAAGFTQTILVTHDEISEQFADHLVTL